MLCLDSLEGGVSHWPLNRTPPSSIPAGDDGCERLHREVAAQGLNGVTQDCCRERRPEVTTFDLQPLTCQLHLEAMVIHPPLQPVSFGFLFPALPFILCLPLLQQKGRHLLNARRRAGAVLRYKLRSIWLPFCELVGLGGSFRLCPSPQVLKR